jgi:hypothetical protein
MRSRVAQSLATSIEIAVKSAPPAVDRIVLNAGDPPLDNARKLLEQNMGAVSKLAADSPRFNPAHANMRAWIKLVAEMERELTGDETPEEAAARKRREDTATREMIERYVSEYEADAADEGVCLWCEKPIGDDVKAKGKS